MKVDVRHKRYLKYQLTMQDLLFWIAYIPWMFSWMLTYTWLKPIIHPYGIGKIWTLIGIILLFLRAIYVRNSGFFMVSLIGIMLFITFLVRLGNDNVNFILYTIILILSVGDIEVDDIVKVTFYLQVILLCITVLPAAIGIIHNEAQYSENGVRLRHLLGFRYCTDSANFYLSIILEYIYLYRKKGIGIIKTIIFISIGYYIYAQTDTKEAFLLVILAFIMERLLRPFDFRRSYTLRAIIKYQYWGYALVSIISSILYVKNGALEKINVALNSRLDLAHRGLMKWGVKIFGVSVKWISKGSTYNYIDSSFINVLICYGILLFLFLLIGYTTIGSKAIEKNDQGLYVVLIIWGIHAMINPQIYLVWYNPFLFMFNMGCITKEIKKHYWIKKEKEKDDMISIICVYNNDKILNECLKESLQLQKQIEYETIFVDSRKYKFHSAAEALNYAGNLANGEYLIFLHQDIVLVDNTLSEIYDYCKNNQFGIMGVAGAKYDYGEIVDYSKIVHGLKKKNASTNYDFRGPLQVDTLDECLLVIPRRGVS